MTLLAAASEVDITPMPGLPMDGYMARVGVNQGTHDPLLAQVLVLDDSRLRTAIIALDVVAVSAVFADRLRYLLAVLLDTSPGAIMVCASHTHAGPAGLVRWLADSSDSTLNQQLMSSLEERISAAARTALDRLAPARIAYSAGELSGLGMDRNRPVAAAESTVTVFRLESADGKPIAVVFHYACHPTVLGPQLDY